MKSCAEPANGEANCLVRLPQGQLPQAQQYLPRNSGSEDAELQRPGRPDSTSDFSAPDSFQKKPSMDPRNL
jgi:hypothetical protein